MQTSAGVKQATEFYRGKTDNTNRKPRVFTSLDLTKRSDNRYSLDDCIAMQRNFDVILEDHRGTISQATEELERTPGEVPEQTVRETLSREGRLAAVLQRAMRSYTRE